MTRPVAAVAAAQDVAALRDHRGRRQMPRPRAAAAMPSGGSESGLAVGPGFRLSIRLVLGPFGGRIHDHGGVSENVDIGYKAYIDKCLAAAGRSQYERQSISERNKKSNVL
jgi:hypothetical protein